MKNTDAPKGDHAYKDNVKFTPKSLGKLDAMLKRFSEGRQYHRFSAEMIGDHCLPTTVSDLQKRHNIRFERKTIQVKNRFGGMSSVCLYWLEGQDLDNARNIVIQILLASRQHAAQCNDNNSEEAA